jgi:hypothetical protein
VLERRRVHELTGEADERFKAEGRAWTLEQAVAYALGQGEAAAAAQP